MRGGARRPAPLLATGRPSLPWLRRAATAPAVRSGLTPCCRRRTRAAGRTDSAQSPKLQPAASGDSPPGPPVRQPSRRRHRPAPAPPLSGLKALRPFPGRRPPGQRSRGQREISQPHPTPRLVVVELLVQMLADGLGRPGFCLFLPGLRRAHTRRGGGGPRPCHATCPRGPTARPAVASTACHPFARRRAPRPARAATRRRRREAVSRKCRRTHMHESHLGRRSSRMLRLTRGTAPPARIDGQA